MELQYYAQFLLDKEKDNPTAKLRYRIKWDRNIVAFNLGYRVEIEKWSTETQRCKINTSHGDKKIAASIINRRIQLYESVCEKIFKNFQLEEITPDQNNFRNSFNVGIGKTVKVVADVEKTFFEVFDEFTREESKLNNWTFSTEDKFRSLKKHLLNFDKNIHFKDLTESGLFDYQDYLANKLKFRNSTIIKHFSFVKWFLKWAKKKGYNSENAFEFFKPKLKTTAKKLFFLPN